MKPDIVRKLNREVRRPIRTERQAVYILVEARKLLEQQGTLEKFRGFKLCSDWAVHPKLRGPDAQLILSYFDAYEAEYQKSGLTMAEFKLQPLHDFLALKSFRDEMMTSLRPHDVEVAFVASDDFWKPFVQRYMSVIQDCPLEAWGQNTTFVSHVSAQAWPEDMADGIYPGKRVVQWNWTLKNSQERKLICALI
jgi:hypothetical protein